jgi:flagellar hook-associated protein FlgK
LQSGIEELDKLPYDSLEESYNNMISAMHNVQGFPSNSSVKAFNASSKNFAESVTEFSDRIANIKSQTTDNISLNQREVDSLQAALEAMNDRGVADEDEVNSIKSQLMQATDNIAAYQKILDKIIPPIETLFKTGVEQTMGDINFAMAQDVLNSYPFDLEQNTFSGIFSSDITTLAKTRTPTFDDDKFTGIIGSMKTDVGVLMVNADAKVKSSTSYMDTIKKSYDKTFGVDMVEESVKMMQMQQLYQANAMAIKVQDNLFQTTINLIA